MPNDSLSDEDKALFRQLMSDVKPLNKIKRVDEVTPINLVVKQDKGGISSTPARIESIYLSDYYVNEVQSNTVLSYLSHSIPNKRLRELKNGLIPWQSRLDLH